MQVFNQSQREWKIFVFDTLNAKMKSLEVMQNIIYIFRQISADFGFSFNSINHCCSGSFNLTR